MAKKIIVASNNPVKIEAVRRGFEKMFPGEGLDISGVSVPSGVSDQPMSDGETLKGAMNRIMHAISEYPDADFWVGLEGGLNRSADDMDAFAWICIKGADLTGKARTATFNLPPKIVHLIKEGMELGQADDIVFGVTNSKQKNGAVGILTDNVIDRTSYYTEAVILALIPFKNKDLFSDSSGS